MRRITRRMIERLDLFGEPPNKVSGAVAKASGDIDAQAARRKALQRPGAKPVTL